MVGGGSLIWPISHPLSISSIYHISFFIFPDSFFRQSTMPLAFYFSLFYIPHILYWPPINIFLIFTHNSSVFICLLLDMRSTIFSTSYFIVSLYLMASFVSLVGRFLYSINYYFLFYIYHIPPCLYSSFMYCPCCYILITVYFWPSFNSDVRYLCSIFFSHYYVIYYFFNYFYLLFADCALGRTYNF